MTVKHEHLVYSLADFSPLHSFWATWEIMALDNLSAQGYSCIRSISNHCFFQYFHAAIFPDGGFPRPELVTVKSCVLTWPQWSLYFILWNSWGEYKLASIKNSTIKIGFYSSWMQLQYQSPTVKPHRGEKTHYSSTFKSAVSQQPTPLFSPWESEQGYHRTSRNSFKTICKNHKAETSRYNLYLQFLPKSLWGASFSYLGGNKQIS